MTTNATLTPEKTVGELVAERPSRSRVFEALGIDYCCGGKLPLSDACQRKGLDAASVLATLSAAEAAAPRESGPDPSAMNLTELCDHIETVHHRYLVTELPRIGAMARKVAAAHGERFAWTVELNTVVEGLAEELLSHMMKEEQILFPAIRDLEAGRAPSTPCGGHIEGPISVMEMEHDSAGNALARLRALSGGYEPPAGACNTFRALLDALAELEADLHQHIHKENNVLFPRAKQAFAA